MDSQVLDLKIISAYELKKQSPFSSSLQPYVVVSFSGPGASSPAQKTPVDFSGGCNPTWNHPLIFSLPSDLSTSGNLKFQIFSRRSLATDKVIGEISVPLRDLLYSGDYPGKLVSYQVKNPSGTSKGFLTFSYKFSGKKLPVAVEEPVMAYPANTLATATAYPPSNFYTPPSYGYPAQMEYGSGTYGYGYPNQPSYGYGSGYGYNGQMVQPIRKKNNGLGVGASLLGGALAGLVVGDLVSDAAFDFGGGDGFF